MSLPEIVDAIANSCPRNAIIDDAPELHGRDQQSDGLIGLAGSDPRSCLILNYEKYIVLLLACGLKLIIPGQRESHQLYPASKDFILPSPRFYCQYDVLMVICAG